eukprot:9476581-Pyramimonas_sp.AAC.3
MPTLRSCWPRATSCTTGSEARILFHLSIGCCAHRIMRLIEHVFSKQLMGDVYAIAFATGAPKHHGTLLNCLAKLVDDELELVVQVEPRWSLHMADVLRLTVGREFQYSSSTGENQGGRLAVAKMEQLKAMLNGDLRKKKLQHFCNGCCVDRADAVMNMTAALSGSGLISDGSVPSKNRWGTMARHNALHTCGFLFHDFKGRLLREAFAGVYRDDGSEVNDLDDVDYRQRLRWPWEGVGANETLFQEAPVSGSSRADLD